MSKTHPSFGGEDPEAWLAGMEARLVKARVFLGERGGKPDLDRARAEATAEDLPGRSR